jgi:hypothetical protein
MKNRHGLAGVIALLTAFGEPFQSGRGKRRHPAVSDARQYRPEILQWSRKFLAGRRFASALNRVGHVI